MPRIAIIHPEGNIANNPNLFGIVEILCEQGYEVDYYCRRQPHFDQQLAITGVHVYATDIIDVEELAVILPHSAKLDSGVKAEVRSAFSGYDLLIGIDRGIIEAAWLARLCSIPYGLISYEIYFGQETGLEFKQPEQEACQDISFAVCQDRVRSLHLARENSIPLAKIIDIPVAGRAFVERERSYVLHDLLGIERSCKIALYIGETTSKWAGFGELLESTRDWDESWALVLHHRYGQYSQETRRLLKNSTKAYCSPFPQLKHCELPNLLNAADLGIAFYLPQMESTIFQDRNNLLHIGMASGKIATYLQHGLPIIVNEIGLMSEYVRQLGLGTVVSDILNTGEALQKIDHDVLAGCSTRAKTFFREYLDLNKTVAPLLDIIGKLVSDRFNAPARLLDAPPIITENDVHSYRELTTHAVSDTMVSSVQNHQTATAPMYPKISVITPSFNQGKFIEQTIQSVLAQNYPNFEHIVIDGGSTDGTIEIFKRYPHLKWFSEKDNGQSDALNKGFKMASGDIIAWINSDDWYEESVFQIIADYFQRYPERNVVMGSCNLVDESGNIFDKVINYERGFDELKKHWIARSIPTQPAVFFRKALFDQYGYLDESLHYAMDYDLWMRFAQHNTFHHIDLTVANYRFHSSAKGGDQDWNKFIPDCVKVYNRYCMPLVSVIIPCYNYGKYLAEAISSVFAQTFQDFEIIIVNDGSTDNTIEIATKLIEYYHQYPIKLINQANSGHPAHTRNRGISEAVGTYILPLDADDKLHPLYLESLVNALEDNSTYDIAYCDTVRFGDENISYSNPDWDPDLLLSHNYLNYCSLYRRKVWEKLGGYKSCGYEDWEFWINSVEHGFKAVRIPQALFYYRVKNTGKLAQDQERDDEHIARIMLMHTKLYTREQLEWAGNTININKQHTLHHSDVSINVTKRSRILCVTYGWHESGGGTTFPKSVALELAARGYDVAVFYASLKNDPSMSPYSIEKKEDAGVILYGVFNRPALFTDADNPEREICDAGVLNRFQQVLDEVNPDLIHFHNFHGLTFALAEETHRRGIPSCFTPHNYHLIDPDLYLLNSDLSLWSDIDLFKNSDAVRKNPDKKEWYEKRVSTTRKLLNEWVDVTLSVSSRQRDLLIQHGGDPEKIALVHQANKSTDKLWNNDFLTREAVRPLHAPLRVGFVGGAIPIKGVHYLVAAAQAFRSDEIEVHIYGTAAGIYLERLIVLDRKGMVTFHGEYSAEDLTQIAAKLDLSVVPSVIEDCAPLTLLEQHAMRLPIIAARIGGIPDFITEGIDGLLYDPFDLKSLVGVLRICIDNPSLVEKMRRNLSKPTHTFSRYMEHLEKVYDLMLTGQKPGAAALSLTINRREAVAEPDKASITWHGALFAQHSLAHVNRELCLQLLERGHAISFDSTQPDDFISSVDPRFNTLESIRNAQLKDTEIHIHHQWPPDFTPPASGHWIMIQPWEYGSIPRIWIEKMTAMLDDLWVPSSFVRDCYIASGLPEGRVHVVPNGVDVASFNPAAPPFKISSSKRFRFLFVGGTIYRKGIDLLLAAYRAVFSINDDVCLVIKDMGGGSFYQGQTAQEMIQRFQEDPLAPEIEYLDNNIVQNELPGLYTACHCLVHPYRGEGFGLPIAEAMACGLAPIVTGYGAALDFCPPEIAWLISAEKHLLPEKKIGNLETVDYPWLAEPNLDKLSDMMRYAFEHPEEAIRRGQAACEHIRGCFTWDHAARCVDARLQELRTKPVVRFTDKTVAPDPAGEVLTADESARRELVANVLEKARILQLRGEIETAVSILIQQGIGITPEWSAPYLALAELLLVEQRFTDAIEVLSEMPSDPEQVVKSEIEALCYAALGNDEVAQQAAIQAQGWPRARVVLGTLAARRGDVAEAEKQFRRAIDDDPSCGSAWLSLGMLLWGQGKQADAWTAVKRSVTVDPLNREAVRIMRDMAGRLG